MFIGTTEGNQRANTIIVLGILVAVITCLVSTMYVERGYLFDDSFITYRYAKNLANGQGITWNPGEAPVEGYTNFLLVVVLAPFIRIGSDPLLVTRVLSALAAIGIAVVCGLMARRHFKAGRAASFLVALAFIPASPTIELSILGLETVQFSFMLFLAFFFALEFYATRRPSRLYLCAGTLFLALLLRPEGALLAATIGLMSLLPRHQRRETFQLLCRAFGVAFALPLGIYLLWKVQHFGALLPNAFYIKADSPHLFSATGVASVTAFAQAHWTWIAVAVGGMLMKSPEGRLGQAVAGTFTLLYMMFFTHVDTLMDMHHRFLYPVLPFVFFLMMSVLAPLATRLCQWRLTGVLKVPLVLLVYALLFFPQPRIRVADFRNALKGTSYYDETRSVRQRRYRTALALHRYERVRDILLAYGDAGVVPYYSEARHLDAVGLNDRFIARNTNIAALTDYFFSRQPTLIIHPGNFDNTWIRFGHGPLGDHSKWASDPRWDEYVYAGTISKLTGLYDGHCFVRKHYADFAGLVAHIQTHVADTIHQPFPLPIGSYRPPG